MWQFIKEHWILSTTVSVIVISVIIGAIVVQINRSPDGLENNSADIVFSFFNDWAVTLGAAAAVVLAVIALSTILHTSRQVKLMTEQRRNSIRPFLQIDKIWPVLHRDATTQFHPPLELKNPQISYIVVPSMQVQMSNLGSGAAVRFNMSASIVLEFNNEDTGERYLRRYHFKLPKQSGDQYIEPTKDKPRNIDLDFSHSDSPDSIQIAGRVECSLTYYDIDGNYFPDPRSYQLLRDECIRNINESETIPGNWDYPHDLLNSNYISP